MWRVLCEICSVFLIGCAIKIMDDHLDQEPGSLALKLGRAALPYSLLLTAVAAALAPYYSVPLFLASYSCGMNSEFRERLPTRLLGWHESVAAALLSLSLFGWRLSLSAVITILFIQLVDDWYDIKQDRLISQSNLVNILGYGEAVAVMLVLAAWACVLNCKLFVVCLVMQQLVEGVLQWGSAKL